jgi:hypothetical protein
VLWVLILVVGALNGWPCCGAQDKKTARPETPPFQKETQELVRVAQLIPGRAVSRHYPYALPTLLKHVAEKTSVNVIPEPVIIESFEDERIFDCPYIYANFADRSDWTFSERERTQLKGYLSRGGFLYIDAGINAEFLRESAALGQHHSFGEWDACPQLKEAFGTLFPGKAFRPLSRSHPIFRVHHAGLPDPAILPDTVREFVVNEKWPDGTYSAVGLKVGGRLAVLVTPIIAMGWGRNTLGNWRTTIRFRVRETTEGLSDYLRTAAYSGARFEVVREDAGQDVIFCQKRALPAWVNEPEGDWRVFRYYGSREISDFAHVFYTRLGVNFLLYALTH